MTLSQGSEFTIVLLSVGTESRISKTLNLKYVFFGLNIV